MKQYVTGLLALGFAISAFSFTKESKKIVNGKEVGKAFDPCAQSSKRWWIINLECDAQNLSKIRNPGYYTLSTIQEVSELCTGTTCVCAIFACPTAANDYPVISSGTSIYAELTNFVMYGTTSPDIITKDTYVGRK
jgi:hypothetical protein